MGKSEGEYEEILCTIYLKLDGQPGTMPLKLFYKNYIGVRQALLSIIECEQ